MRTFRCHFLITKTLQEFDQLTQVDLTLKLQAKDRISILKEAVKVAKENDYILTSIEEI